MEQLDVQQIMETLRERVGSQEDGEFAEPLPSFEPELRAHLVHLQQLANSLRVESAIQPSSFPILGRWITWWRTQIHQLVLYYMNSLIQQQLALGQAVTRTLILLAEHLTAENSALRAEVEDLRRELARQPTASSKE